MGGLYYDRAMEEKGDLKVGLARCAAPLASSERKLLHAPSMRSHLQYAWSEAKEHEKGSATKRRGAGAAHRPYPAG
jgi:hypothetical protein